MQKQSGRSYSQDGFEKHVYDNAQQRIQILSSAPTAAEPLITEGNIGYYNNKIYWMIDGTLKEFAVSSTP